MRVVSGLTVDEVTRMMKDAPDDCDAVPGLRMTFDEPKLVPDWVDFLWNKGRECLEKNGEHHPEVHFLEPGGAGAIVYMVNALLDPSKRSILQEFGHSQAKEHNAIAVAVVADVWAAETTPSNREKLPRNFSDGPFRGRKECFMLQYETTAQPPAVRSQRYDRVGGGIRWLREDGGGKVVIGKRFSGWVYSPPSGD